jgi:FAD/FMN-containing dehydrogenase
MSTLAAVREVNPADALVEDGARWIDLLRQTIPHGLTSPTLVDFIELSIGGTLSLGGIGGQSFRHGPQADNVLELQVVTGEGELVACSPSQNRTLFDAARSGLGQAGLVVVARVRLIPAPPNVRYYKAYYDDLPAFLSDLEGLIDDGRFDTVQGFAGADGSGGWRYLLETTKYFAPGGEPDDSALPAGLSFNPGTETAKDMPYFDYLNRLAPLVAFLRQVGAWDLPRPWFNMLLPAAVAPGFIGEPSPTCLRRTWVRGRSSSTLSAATSSPRRSSASPRVVTSSPSGCCVTPCRPRRSAPPGSSPTT